MSNITIYTQDVNGIFAGAVECDPLGPVPPGTLTPPPTLTPPQVAQWQGDAWVVLPEYPPAPPPAPTPEPDWRTPMMVELRAKRDTLLNVLDGIQADALTSGNTADAISCKNIKAALKGVPELPSVVNATSATALKMATIMAYQSAIAGAPVGVLALFAGYLK